MRRQNVAQIVHGVRRCILVDENQLDRAPTRLDHSVASRILHVPRTDRIIAGLAERCSQQRAPPLIGHDDENTGSKGHWTYDFYQRTRRDGRDSSLFP